MPYKLVNNDYIELTDEEVAQLDADREAADLDLGMQRSQRRAFLAATDATQLSDYPLGAHTAEEWQTFRQALRDLPAAYDRVSTWAWPKSPPITAAGQAAYDTEVAKEGSGPAAGETARTAAEGSAGYPGPGI